LTSNPILPGFHPDPSICRAGDDFYLVTSSFEYLPGVPIFHSRDLLRWKQIGNVLDRDDQLVLSGLSSGGVYAPTLRYCDGRFWMITTNVEEFGKGHLIVTATDPAGPWSTPVYTAGALGIDPDLTWDRDGTCYLTWASVLEENAISQAAINPGTGTLLTEPRALWSGTGLAHPEAPHLYHRNSWWYLLLAEGGTERGHAVSVARSRSITGPYEGNPANPILTHRSTSHPVQNTGHADLVELPSGDWAAVYLGVRPRGTTPMFHVNGRESFLAAIRWEDDWPVFDENHYPVPEPDTAFDDDFSAPVLNPRWISPGIHPARLAAPASHGGVAVTATDSPGRRGLLAVRAKDAHWEASAVIDAGRARLALRLDDAHWAGVDAQGESITVRAVIGGLDHVVADAPRAHPGAVTLTVRAVAAPPGAGGPDQVELGYQETDTLHILARVDGRYFSTEVAGGFTGRTIGIEALADVAVVSRFSYRPASPLATL